MCVAAAIGGGAIVGGLISAHGAQSAASSQAGAAEQAAQIGQNEFNTITAQEAPWRNAGGGAQQLLNNYLGIGKPMAGQGGNYGSLLQPFTAQNFQQLSPAYQFQRQQGMQGTLNQDASGQGALSGAAQKDLMGYNQGLANTSFNNAFNMYQTQQGNIYQRLAGISQLGQAAAANTGQQGTALTGQIGQAISNVGTAQAGGQVGQANAISGGIQSAMPWLYAANQGGFGSSYMGPSSGSDAQYFGG